MGHEEALIDHSVAGHAADVKVVGVVFGKAGLIHRMLNDLSYHIELAFELGRVQPAGAGADEYLADVRTNSPGVSSQLGVVQWEVSPPQQLKTFIHDYSGDKGASPFPGFRSGRKEHHPHAVFPFRRQVDSQGRCHLAEEFVGHLDQESRAVAGLRIASASPAVAKVDQDLKPLFNYLVGFPALDVGYDTHPAAIVFVLR